jgi:hypothetical protein
MADVPEHIRKTLDELQADLIPTAGRLRDALALINSIERHYGLSLTTPNDLLGQSGEGGLEPPQEGTLPPRRTTFEGVRQSGGRISIRADQYFGREPLDAAKIFLGELGHAAHIDEITEAIQRGGAATKGANWKEVLEMSLLRSVYDVVKVQDHTFGLIKFYSEEQIKRLRDTRRQTGTGKTVKRGQKKHKPKNSKDRAQKETKPTEQAKPSPEQIARMKELQAEGKPLKEIAKEFGLHHLAVYHLLGGKLKAAKPPNAA